MRRSARPSPKCSAPRSESSHTSSRDGTGSYPGKSRAAARGTSASGCRKKFLDGFDDILRDAATLIPLDKPPVILTGEYIPENFLLSQEGTGWRLSGLFDFGDVMTGWGEYDLLGPSAFMAAGNPRRMRSLFEGFGYAPADINPAMKRRLMALMLLHRASDPVRHICIEGWQEQGRQPFRIAGPAVAGLTGATKPHIKEARKIFCINSEQICIFVCNLRLASVESISPEI